MVGVKRIKALLDEKGIKYSITSHPKAYTAQRIAAHAHISGKNFIKTIVIKVDGKLALAVLPANDRIGFSEFAKSLQAKKVELASEAEFRDRFPDCETGAMPPFGNLYDMETYIASDLDQSEEISFNACNHIDVLTMQYRDYLKLVKPKVVPFEIH